VVGILIEEGLLHATLVRPAIPGLHLATDLALVEVATIIPLLLNEGNIQGIGMWSLITIHFDCMYYHLFQIINNNFISFIMVLI
jgi:hypothetical protein